MFKLTPIALVLFVTTAINFVVMYISWQRGKTKSGLYFSLGTIGVTVWTLAAAMDYAAVPLDSKIFFSKIEAIGYHSELIFFLLFSISYAGNERWLKKRWVKFLLFLMPLSNILLTITNDLHHWIWSGYKQQANNIYVFEYGPAFSWVTVTAYLQAILIFVNLWMASKKGSPVAQRQARTLMFALLFPVAINLLYRLGAGGIQGVDWSSITFSISGVLVLYALHGTRLLDIMPITRDKLINNLSDGMIVLDTQKRIIDINQAAAEMMASSPEALLGRELETLVPIPNLLLELQSENEVKTELGVGLENKLYFDVLISPLRDHYKTIIGRLIIFRDITRRKENELRLLQLTQAVEQSPASVVITNLQGNIDYVNPRFSTLTGYTPAEVVGKNPKIIQSGQTPAETYQQMWQTIQSGGTWRGELLNRKKNGEFYWELEVVAPVFDASGRIINYIAVKEDITARKEAEVKLQNAYLELEEKVNEIQSLQDTLREQTIRDALTGLYNRRYLNETLGRELARAEREGYPVCFILLDIDHFKNINDKYGHTAGDLVLQNLAKQIQQNTRNGDIICRYGGEEFLAVLPNTRSEVAAQIAERWRAIIETSSILDNNSTISITVSCGISEFPTDGSTEVEAFKHADKALYTAKQNGRNQVELWSKI